MANHIAMNSWRNTFRGALGTYLYDSFGWDIFSLNFSEDFANLFKGLRVDSGDNRAELQRIVEKYRSLGIDSRTKQVIFSNALDTDRAIEIQATPGSIANLLRDRHTFHKRFRGREAHEHRYQTGSRENHGVMDFYNDTCKLSEDDGKAYRQARSDSPVSWKRLNMKG